MNFLVADLTRETSRDCVQQAEVFHYRISRRGKGDSVRRDSANLMVSWSLSRVESHDK